MTTFKIIKDYYKTQEEGNIAYHDPSHTPPDNLRDLWLCEVGFFGR